MWVVSYMDVDQCPLRSLREDEREEEAGKRRKKRFKRWGKGRDGCSPRSEEIFLMW